MKRSGKNLEPPKFRQFNPTKQDKINELMEKYVAIVLLFSPPTVPSSISDGLRSSTSTGTFFKSLDADGSGVVKEDEIRKFVMEGFDGDKEFDEEWEVSRAVKVRKGTGSLP